MLGYSNITADSTDGTATFHTGGSTLKGGRTYIIPWIATARDLSSGSASGQYAAPAMKAVRTAAICYMRGLRERIQIQTNNGACWQWRRICFQFRGNDIYRQGNDIQRIQIETSSGFTRAQSDWGASTASEALNILLFKGRQGTDWQSYMTAKTDPARVTICYDRTRIISSGNSNGVMRNYSLWHPMNKNLFYDQDEVGDREEESLFASKGNRGMGDYYVVDFIAGGTGTTTSDLLSFDPQATLYWHEK